MYIIVREVTNYTNEQLLLLQLPYYTTAAGGSSTVQTLPHLPLAVRFPLDLIIALESWAFSLVRPIQQARGV